MNKLVIATLLCVCLAGATSRTAGPPCAQKEFKTQMVKAACEKGGQDEAKKQMIAFVSKNAEKGQKLTNTKFFTCNACHQNLEPNYDRKAEAYDLYTKLGGK